MKGCVNASYSLKINISQEEYQLKPKTLQVAFLVGNI